MSIYHNNYCKFCHSDQISLVFFGKYDIFLNLYNLKACISALNNTRLPRECSRFDTIYAEPGISAR